MNSNNTTSLKFDNPGVANDNYATNAGGRVTISPSQSLLQPASFTIEAFVKVEDLIQFAGLIGHERSEGGSTWLLDSNPSGHTGNSEPTSMNLRARYDHQTAGSVANGTSPGFNQNFTSTGSLIGNGLGNDWNHVAMTYDEDTKAVTLFVNYQSVGGGTISESGVNDLVYNGGLFFIGGGGGGRGFDGWIDEVRFSDVVLASDEFLRVVPEPGKAVLMGLAGVFFVLRRKRTN